MTRSNALTQTYSLNVLIYYIGEYNKLVNRNPIRRENVNINNIYELENFLNRYERLLRKLYINIIPFSITLLPNIILNNNLLPNVINTLKNIINNPIVILSRLSLINNSDRTFSTNEPDPIFNLKIDNTRIIFNSPYDLGDTINIGLGTTVNFYNLGSLELQKESRLESKYTYIRDDNIRIIQDILNIRISYSL